MSPSPAGRRPPIFGPEPWAEVAGQPWCHFDRWFALVIQADFGGDADSLRRELEDKLRSLHGRGDVVAKLSHLADLRRRLDTAGISPADLVAAQEVDKATHSKANRKVLSQALEWRSRTEPMRDTPAARLEQRARYGYWDRFPTNPDRFHSRLAGRRSSGFVDKGGSFRVVDAHLERLRRLDGPRRTLTDRLALYRAFHTVGIELAERIDDSYGVLGEARRDAFGTYLAIDWSAAGMDRVDYWRDLCELLVSEVYGLTYQHETTAFVHATADDVELIEAILLDLADEHRAAYSDHQADEALELIAWCHIATGNHAEYAEAAARLGTDHWIPVDALARSALDAGRPDLAVAVFRAADRPGLHRDHLRRRCHELTGIDVTG